MNHHLSPEPFVIACVSKHLLNERRRTGILGREEVWAGNLFPMKNTQMGKGETHKYPVGSYARPSGAWTPAVHPAMLLWCHQNRQADPCQNVACGMYGGTVLRAELIQILLEIKSVSFQLLTSANLQWHLQFSWTSFVTVLYGTSFCSHKSLLNFSCKQQTQFFLCLLLTT